MTGQADIHARGRRAKRPAGRSGHRLRWVWTPATILVLVLLVWLLPIFHLSKWEISEELRSLSREAVIADSGLKEGQHLFSGLGGSVELLLRRRYGAAETRLLNLYPTLKSVEIRMHIPYTVTFDLVERVEVAYVSIPDQCVMIDKDGVVLRILDQAPDNLPVIKGIKVTSMQLGAPLKVDVPDALNRAMTLMGAIIEADRDTRTTTRLLSQVRQIRPLSGRQLFLTVVLPDTGEELTVTAETGPDQTDDMLWLRFALDQDAFNGKGKGVLNLTGDNRTFTPD